MKRIIEFPWKSRDKEFLTNWRERSFRIHNAVKEIQKINRKKNWSKQAREIEKLSFDFFGPGSLATIRLFDEYLRVNWSERKGDPFLQIRISLNFLMLNSIQFLDFLEIILNYSLRYIYTSIRNHDLSKGSNKKS